MEEKMALEIYGTARDMIAALEAKQVSARELLDAHVGRNEQVGKKINAVVASDLERAYAAADAIDNARTKGRSVGALAGIPMTVKDGFDIENMPAVAGSKGLVGRDARCADAELVRRTRAN